jgi:hypothetical protein
MQGNGNLSAIDAFDAPVDKSGQQMTMDLVIDPPIEWNNKTYDSLHLEEPTARMVERATQELITYNLHTARKYQISLVSQASGVPRQVIDQLRISQLTKASDFLTGFIASGQAIGVI